jgi:hypothetical protein
MVQTKHRHVRFINWKSMPARISSQKRFKAQCSVSYIEFRSWLTFATCNVDELSGFSNAQTISPVHRLVDKEDYEEKLPCTLGHIFWFAKMMQDSKSDGSHLVLCAGHDAEIVSKFALILGCYLILCDDMPVQEVMDRFGCISHQFVQYGRDSSRGSDCISVHDCWRAMSHAKGLEWIDFTTSEVDIDRCIDMQEYHHYDNIINGSLHVLVPSQLLVFASPSVLPTPSTPGKTWQVILVSSRGQHRNERPRKFPVTELHMLHARARRQIAATMIPPRAHA